MSRTYLKELNLNTHDDFTCVPNTTVPDDERNERFHAQRAEYGFDERETWSMDFTLACWIYEHFRWYQDFAPIDTDFHKITVPVVTKTKKNGKLKKEKQTVTQGKAIELVLEYIKIFVKYQHTDDIKADEHLRAALGIVKELMPCMWW